MSLAPKPPPLRLADDQTPPAIDPDGEFFARLPLSILANRLLSDGAKLLVAAIADAARASGVCGDSNEVLAARIGKKPTSIPRLLAELQTAEVIDREQRGPFRSIRLNFRFRGIPAKGESWRAATEDPRNSARVGQESNLAGSQANPGKTASQAPRPREESQAPARPTIRLSRAQQDPEQKSGAGPARVGQAPPDPAPDQAMGPDEVASLADTTGFEATIRAEPVVGRGLKPITAADLLTVAQVAERERVSHDVAAPTRAKGQAFADLARHNKAIWLRVKKELPDDPAQGNARPLALESQQPGASEVGSEATVQSTGGPGDVKCSPKLP